MIDPRVAKSADILVNYSTKIKKGEYVQIHGNPNAKDLILEVYKLCIKNGAYPTLKIGLPGTNYLYYKHASDEQLNHFPERQLEEMKKTDAIIFIGGGENTRELTQVDPDKISLRQKTTRPIQDERLKKKWVIYYYPTSSLAQEAEMSTEEFEDFVFNSTNIDWAKTSEKLQKVQKLMSSGTEISIIGEETDIKFSTKGRKYVVADGSCNMPDGEIFTAPVEDSTEGTIAFSYPSIYGGREVDGIKLEFKKGKIIKSTAEKNQDFLRTMISTDEGSLKLGEFGIGLNPGIIRHVKNTLFDEKQNQTIHLAIGSAYPECGGVNKSAVHWDLIKDMRKNSRILLDGKVVAKNGKFIL
jgi:aminopeptidase